jgi:CRISPR system Cascade subunit CasD
MKACIFQIYGPLVSWGEIAVGGTRRSAMHPSRSAILGLVAAALGIKREAENDLAELGRSLSIAFRVDAPGTLLTDYHTVQAPRRQAKKTYRTRKEEVAALDEKDNAILSSREYRCDAYALAAVCVRDGRVTLEQIAESLRLPTFHLYFGRKSAPPALPLHPQVVEADNLHEAFTKAEFPLPLPVDDTSHEWQIKSFTRYSQSVFQGEQSYYYWEEGMTSGIDHLQMTTPYDDPISRGRWQFRMRREYMAVETTRQPKEEDADVH